MRPDTKVELKCQNCGKDFRVSPSHSDHKFCSKKCYLDFRKKIIEYMAKCANCGKEFNKGKHLTQKFCSQKCAGKSRKCAREKKCAECGSIINYKPYQASKMRYCSRKCFGKATQRKFQIELQCEFCGKIFLARRFERDTAGRRFCSTICANLAITANRLNYTCEQINGLILRSNSIHAITRLAKEIFGDKCAICGWNEMTCDVHHIEPKKKSNDHDLTNLIILCPNHHRMSGSKNPKISKDELRKHWDNAYAYIMLSNSNGSNYAHPMTSSPRFRHLLVD